MRNLLRGALIGPLIASAPAFAQQAHLKDVAVETITLEQGETRMLQVDQAFRSFALDPVAEVRPQTDHVFAIKGVAPGETLMTLFAENGQVVYSARVVVPGHMVKIYGTKDAGTDYESHICTGTHCGRVNPDVEPVPDKTTLSETRRQPNGDSSTVEKEYRR